MQTSELEDDALSSVSSSNAGNNVKEDKETQSNPVVGGCESLFNGLSWADQARARVTFEFGAIWVHLCLWDLLSFPSNTYCPFVDRA